MTSATTDRHDADDATTPVLLHGARTPFTRFRGALASLSATALGAHAIRGALDAAGVAASDVDAVIMGQVIQAGAGQGPARQAAIAAGIGWDVPATTVNKLCLSGLTAIIDAARLVRTGEAQVVVAGGQESMTNAPHLLLGSRDGHAFGDVTMADSLTHDGLRDPFDGQLMGEATDRGCATREIGRPEQDAFAARSHTLAAAAHEAGRLADEIAPVSVPQRRGEPVVVADDEGIRPGTTVETLAGLRPAFVPDGTITAGSSSPLSDGAAAVVVASKAWARAQGLEWLAEIRSAGQTAGPDNSLHSQPARAIAQAVEREGVTVDELDLVEINEAFAAVALQSVQDLGVDEALVNADGGAIALGHPVGASGARLALHLALALSRRGGGLGVAALCGGGGQGDALILRA
ncbi:acetyl-CoA C-acetyltransferase [Sediminihabitans luteus]|uniref:Probable acetyl-CoA acetyltransferase n=1 Tax=Sediminihabitans luteus TaxID=1138585 RepID=A0A2M9CEK3_9CELL|nr:acetyl-CoA C-acetyltransferase [Sediminihabitans luteus]PJJ70361.1 acetyl-CoA C-acetyltransferase [Sediminihabitans luteus]GII97833.1 putative acetyl-CoA acetyltransferase FadA [Sediminihabitans luteus]